VATILPRNIAPVDATALNVEGLEKSAAGDAALPPPELARRIVGLDRQLTEETNRAARALAGALGARVIDAMSIAGKQLSPDLYVAIGVEGSTEHNAALRNSRIVVAIVENPSAPIAQIADYLLVGDISEHTRALLASL
jgi:electron transfer flavoprotein alpha subunit